MTKAINEILQQIADLPSNDYSTDGDAAELIKRDDVLKIIRKAFPETQAEPEPLQFIKHSEKLWWVCLDGRYLGSIHNLLTGLFHVSIYSDSRKLSLSNSYTSFDLAEKAVREHFGEGAFNAFEWLP